MPRKQPPLSRSFNDPFIGFKIEAVPRIMETGTPAIHDICVIIPSTLFKQRADITGSVFTAERLDQFIKTYSGIFETRTAMKAKERLEKQNRAKIALLRPQPL